MRRVTHHLVAFIIILAIIVRLQHPADPVHPPTTANQNSVSLMVTPPDLQIPIIELSTTPPPSQSAEPPPRRIRGPYPKPTRIVERVLPDDDLSIRGLGLGMSQNEVWALYPSPTVVDRLTTYWRNSYRDFDHIGVTWYEYDGFQASFDRFEICGALIGNGLERYGIPILAVGDGGNDVERVLGPPSACDASHYSPIGMDDRWYYRYSDYGLTIYFTKGKINRFELRHRDFSDSCC